MSDESMTELNETTQDDDVATMLRNACQGEGLTEAFLADWLEGRGGDPGKATQVMERIVAASELVTNREHRRAIRNALAIEGTGKNLTDRRMSYLEKVDVSYRTLIRHEAEGAEAIATLMPRLTENSQGLSLLSERLDDIEAVLLAIAGATVGAYKYAHMDSELSRIDVGKRRLTDERLLAALAHMSDRYGVAPHGTV